LKRYFFVIIVLALVLAGCDGPPITSTPTPSDITVTALPTTTATEVGETAVPTGTEVPPTSTQEPTATPVVITPLPTPGSTGNLFVNPDMQEWVFNQSSRPSPYYTGAVEVHNLPDGWEGFYHDKTYICLSGKSDPYTSTCIDIPASAVGGDPEAAMGRPEFKLDTIRVHEGKSDPYGENGLAAQWFWWNRPGQGGLQQYIALPAHTGLQCRIEANVQIWTRKADDGATGQDPFTSVPRRVGASEDDKRGVGIFVFASAAPWGYETSFFVSQTWQYPGTPVIELPLDTWKRVVYTFSIPAGVTEVFAGFGGINVWGHTSDFYVDDALFDCYGEIAPVTPQPTPTPIAPTPAPTEPPVIGIRPQNADVNVVEVDMAFFPLITLATFTDHQVDWGETVREDIPAGNPLFVRAYFQDPVTGERWFALDGGWVKHGQYDLYIWSASEWIPWYIDLGDWSGQPETWKWMGWTNRVPPELPYE